MEAKTKEKKNIKFDAFVIIFLVIVFAYILSLIVPSGEFAREDIGGRSVVIPGSYTTTEKTYLSPAAIFQSVPNGLTAAASMMFVVMMVSGAVEIYQRTESIDLLMASLLKKSDKVGSNTILILIMITFGLIGGFLGWNEQIVPFIPIIISLCVAMGYDVLTGIACSAMIDMISFAVSPSSVYTVGISHEIAQLPMFSGFGFRLALLVIFDIIIIIYVLRYANKVKKNPELSLVKDIDDSEFRIDYSELLNRKMTGRQKAALIVFLITFIGSIIGVSKLGWSMNDLGAAFFFLGIAGGVICGYNINEIVDGFIAGFKQGLVPALVIGLARGIQWILTTGQVIDPIIYYLSEPLAAMGKYTTPLVVVFIITLFNGLIGSGSAKATALMPILIPLADLVGMTRQTMVLAFQLGDGLTNVLWFTSGTLLMFLAIAKIPLKTWYKFVWKLMVILTIVGLAGLMVAINIGYGPF